MQTSLTECYSAVLRGFSACADYVANMSSLIDGDGFDIMSLLPGGEGFDMSSGTRGGEGFDMLPLRGGDGFDMLPVRGGEGCECP